MSRWSGRCLCGFVRYEVDGPLRDVIVCHCVECRRWAGCAWPATAARREQFAVIVGKESLRWEASPASVASARRANCASCGAALCRSATYRPFPAAIPGRPRRSPGTERSSSRKRLEGR